MDQLEIVDQILVIKQDHLYPGIWGWLAIISVVTGCDIWAKKSKKSTMSNTFWHYKDWKKNNPLISAALIASWLGLTYHLLMEDYVKDLRHQIVG